MQFTDSKEKCFGVSRFFICLYDYFVFAQHKNETKEQANFKDNFNVYFH